MLNSVADKVWKDDAVFVTGDLVWRIPENRQGILFPTAATSRHGGARARERPFGDLWQKWEEFHAGHLNLSSEDVV